MKMLSLSKLLPIIFTGVANANGDAWRHYRSLAITSLKNFGFGKSSMENTIQEESSVLIKYIDDQHGHPFEIGNIFHKVTSNVICSLIFGERCLILSCKL